MINPLLCYSFLNLAGLYLFWDLSVSMHSLRLLVQRLFRHIHSLCWSLRDTNVLCTFLGLYFFWDFLDGLFLTGWFGVLKSTFAWHMEVVPLMGGLRENNGVENGAHS